MDYYKVVYIFMENKKLQDMSVVELKAYLFDLQGHVETVRQVLLSKLQQPVETVEENK